MSTPKAVTLKDIAEQAHVSQAVVSTVLNDRQNGIFVSESTRRNVLAAALDLGYQARVRMLPPVRKPGSGAAQGVGAANTRLVGVLLGRRFGGSLFSEIFYGVNEALSQQGYHPLVLDTYAETYQKAAEKEAEGLRYAQSSRFAGVVLWHEGGSSNVGLIQELRAQMPVVAIDRRVPGLELDYVGTDNFQGAYDATRHLIAQGHTRIAHLTRLETTDAAASRLHGYREALADAGLSFNPRHLLLALDGGRRLDRDGLAHVFSAPNAPTAIFLMADFWAPTVYTELRRLGLCVPEDVALVGFDDVVPPGLAPLELSSVAQDFEGIGKTAGALVLRRLAEPEAPTEARIYPAHLVVRASSQAPPKPSAPPAFKPPLPAASAPLPESSSAPTPPPTPARTRRKKLAVPA